ncbi:MAG: bifunctional DNA-formamidopyrimidine glycosylase/DNA-(apurinic or apyrimidinic site) lyase [Victivallaceae bacterium]|nr:bifunctional DNA-formamidopyrimidine glycosylase/DNA-(apurinic or apyrimidinic site) lyase [Victivallaceae bacterium]
MPELPEAENIGRALSKFLPGRSVCRVEVFSPAMREPLTPLLTARLEGLTITDVRRRGRYLVCGLSDGRAFLMHFGMSGVVRVEPPGTPKRKHEHLFIHLSDGMIFKFECTRRFSLFKVCSIDRATGWPPELAGLGVEPLDAMFDGEFLWKASRRRSGCVKNFIMDNSVVVGIGNIYATETLFAAGISPERVAGALTRPECDRLVREAKRILLRSIEMGGSTISDFLNVDGSEGKFARELLIYGKRGGVCPVCGSAIKIVRLGGRSSFYCPKCQK